MIELGLYILANIVLAAIVYVIYSNDDDDNDNY